MTPEHSTGVAVIGGGVIGAFSAYYLRENGWPVTIIEQDTFGSGSSHGNCGLIVPSHILPLNSRENLTCGLKWMLKKDAPLRISPRFDPARFKWMLQFVGNCRPTAIRRSTAGLAALMQGAIDDYRRIIEKESLACGWELQGALHAFMSRKGFTDHRATASVIGRYGVKAQALDTAAAVRREPAVSDRIAGAWFHPQTAHLRPDALMAAFKGVLADAGVRILEQAKVTGFLAEQGRAVAALTGRGPVTADTFVVSAGAWTPLLARPLGCAIPIQPGKGYSVTFDRPAPGPSIPCIFEEARVVATPWKNGFRLGGTMEFSGYDDRLNAARISPLIAAAAHYLRPMDWAGAREAWCGWRPMTPDSLPVIDRSPRLKNVLIAAGHNMLGMTMAPATGRLVAELVSGDPPHVDPAPYRLARFFPIFGSPAG